MAVDYMKALKCAVLSQEIYQDFTTIRFSEFPEAKPELINQKDTDTQFAIIPAAGNSAFIVFQGSGTRLDWNTNLEFQQISYEFQQQVIDQQIVSDQEQIYPYSGGSSSGAQMHQGFTRSYLSVRQQIHDYLKTRSISQVTVTGHSLGGALATLCAVDIQYNFNPIAIEIYTFGAPRVGNEGFRESFNRRVPNSFRFVHGMDIVPALPRPWQGYHHVDTEYRVGKRFSLNFLSQRFKDHSIADYINAIKAAKAS